MKKTKDVMEGQQRIRRNHRKMEAEMVEKGKTPYYLKKGDLKTIKLAEEFEKFKKDKKANDEDLDKFLEKKRKRKASKQKKFMPHI